MYWESCLRLIGAFQGKTAGAWAVSCEQPIVSAAACYGSSGAELSRWSKEPEGRWRSAGEGPCTLDSRIFAAISNMICKSIGIASNPAPCLAHSPGSGTSRRYSPLLLPTVQGA